MTSQRLQTDFYTFANWLETFAKLLLAKQLVGETTGYRQREEVDSQISIKLRSSAHQVPTNVTNCEQT